MYELLTCSYCYSLRLDFNLPFIPILYPSLLPFLVTILLFFFSSFFSSSLPFPYLSLLYILLFLPSNHLSLLLSTLFSLIPSYPCSLYSSSFPSSLPYSHHCIFPSCLSVQPSLQPCLHSLILSIFQPFISSPSSFSPSFLPFSISQALYSHSHPLQSLLIPLLFIFVFFPSSEDIANTYLPSFLPVLLPSFFLPSLPSFLYYVNLSSLTKTK